MAAIPPDSSRMQPPDSEQRITQSWGRLAGSQIRRSPTIAPGWDFGAPTGTAISRNLTVAPSPRSNSAAIPPSLPPASAGIGRLSTRCQPSRSAIQAASSRPFTGLLPSTSMSSCTTLARASRRAGGSNTIASDSRQLRSRSQLRSFTAWPAAIRSTSTSRQRRGWPREESITSRRGIGARASSMSWGSSRLLFHHTQQGRSSPTRGWIRCRFCWMAPMPPRSTTASPQALPAPPSSGRGQ